MGDKMLGVKLVSLVVGLLVMVPETMQLHLKHPLHAVVERVNEQAGRDTILGLVLTSKIDEKQLLSSGYFVPDPLLPFITIAGRKYNVGRFNNVVTVYVLAGEPLASVSATVQILLDNFRIGAIISTGSAGSLVDRLRMGDVAVLRATAYTGVWKWQARERKSLLEGLTNVTLSFGDYNLPEAGDNKLASIDFQTVKRFTPFGSSKRQVFWFPIPPQFDRLTTKLEDVELDRCLDEENCSDEQPKVVLGLKGGSSDIYLLNKAFGNFLKEKVDVSVVDRQSAAVASTAYANGVPFALFRGATNKPGNPSDKKISALAAKNSLKVAATFVEIITGPTPRSLNNNYYDEA